MRTAEELLRRIQNSKSAFGFDVEALAPFLPWEQAKEIVREGVTQESWEGDDHRPLTREAVIDQMRGYMAFAWDKALNQRGISAGRSIEKFEAWIWLLGDEALLDKVERVDYEGYGAPKLAVICREFGFDMPAEAAREGGNQ